MAPRKKNSVKTPKKESPVSVSVKKGGKVQKKKTDSKSKKRVETKVKEAIKTQQSKRKQVSTLNSGRRSSRTNAEDKKKSTPASQSKTTGKMTITKKVATPPKTATGQAASKRKSNTVVKSENRRRTSSKNSQNSSKNETSPLDVKKTVNKMSLRGKKRSYAQLASGNQVESDMSKKRKTVSTKAVTSRGNRSIKPTVKGSEWRNTLLQKKSGSSKPENTKKKTLKSPMKNKSPTVVNKSSQKKRKTVTSKVVDIIKSGSKVKSKTPSPSKTTRGSRLSADKTQKLSTKNAKKVDTVSKSPKSKSLRQSTTKNGESETKSSKENTLSTSIKSKFNSCVSNKRKSRDADFQENILVAQGILHDILGSIGVPDSLTTDEKSENSKEVELGTPVSQSMLEKVNQEEVHENKPQINVDALSEPKNPVVSENDSDSVVIGEEKSVTENAVEDSTTETNIKLNEQNYSSKNKDDHEISSLSVDNSKETFTFIEEREHIKSNGDDTLEEMELHLSTASSTYVNDNELASAESELNTNLTIGRKNEASFPSDSRSLVGDITSENTLEEKSTDPGKELKNKPTSHVNGDEFFTKELCQLGIKKEESISQMESSGNKNVSLSHEKVSIKSPDGIKDNSSNFENLASKSDEDTVVLERSGEVVTSFNQQNKTYDPTLNNSVQDVKTVTGISNDKLEDKLVDETKQSRNETTYSETDCNSSNNCKKEKANVKEIPVMNLGCRTDSGEDCIADEINADKDTTLVGHQDSILSKNKIQSSPIKDSNCVYHSNSHSEKSQNNQRVGLNTNNERSDLIKDKNSLNVSNGDKIFLCNERSQKSVDITAEYGSKSAESKCSVKGSSLEIMHEGNINDKIDDNVCSNLDSEEVKLKENVSVHSTDNSKSEDTADKQCQDNIGVSSKEVTFKDKTQTNSENTKSKLPEKSPLLSKNLSKEEEINTTSPSAQKSSIDGKIVPTIVGSINSINGNTVPEEILLPTKKLTYDDISQSEVLRSNNVEHTSVDEEFKDSLTIIKTENSTNLTKDISKVTSERSSSSSQDEKIPVDEISENFGLTSASVEMSTDDHKGIVISEEIAKMEEGTQEEITEDSIIVDDTDGESMQCASETPSSNRMSIDEENAAGMEVDLEEAAGVVRETRMEVS